ncbi:MAG: Fic family protein [Pseudomonadota bacterium]
MQRQTGKYVNQIEGCRAFLPAPLPPDPPINIDEEMQMLLSKADRALGRLDGSVQALPDADLFVFMYVRKEAVLSSQIEGTQASINDLLEVEAKIFNPEGANDVNEVLNYVAALNLGLSQLSELPVSVRLIRNIHRRLMKDVRGEHAQPGEIRSSQNWIGASGCTLDGAIFVPPPPSDLHRLMADLESFLHNDDPMPLLLKIGLAHAQFETLHPFLDGNGRTGRLLITLLLCEREVLIKPVLYLSHFLKRNRQTYYEMLQATRDEGRLEDWLKFFLRGISEVANEATETARMIVSLREDHRARLVETLGRGAGNGLKLLEALYQGPIFSVADVSELLGVTQQAANTLTERFVNLGLATEMTGNRRNRRFRYDPYIDIFSRS